MTVFEIDVISDFLCMWCYIGKRNLDRAIALYTKTYPSARTDDSFNITYRPYYLNYVTPLADTPSASAPSVPKSVIAERKLAGMSQEKRDALKGRMDAVGGAAGIRFKYGGLIGRSGDSHRLVHVAAESDKESEEEVRVVDALVEGLMRAFHEEERDIADRIVLRDIAMAAGMSESDIEQAFTSDDVGSIVDEEAEKYRTMIDGAGVPTYYINGGQRVDGSQDPGDWYDLFVKIKEGGTVSSQEGTACS